MSPECFDPEKFGLKDGRPTKHSDCYALGMVIYEVLSGRVPFFRHHGYRVVSRILEGKHPERPRGVEEMLFTDGLWDILEHCWRPNPGDRLNIKDVLQYLDAVSLHWTPFSPEALAVGDLDSSCGEITESVPSQAVVSLVVFFPWLLVLIM